VLKFNLRGDAGIPLGPRDALLPGGSSCGEANASPPFVVLDDRRNGGSCTGSGSFDATDARPDGNEDRGAYCGDFER
jgi:hypothetical protein